MNPDTDNQGSAENSDAKTDGQVPATSRRLFRLIRTAEEASDLAEKEHDPFYITAFMIQCWLGELILEVRAEYSDKKDPRERLLQKGAAWRQFQEMFEHSKGEHTGYLVSCLCRFGRAEESSNGSLSRALSLLAIEQQCSSPINSQPSTINSSGINSQPSTINSSSPINYPLSTINSSLSTINFPRLCDWLEAVIHFRAHQHWHLAPICFDPDAEKRELAALGTAQRHMKKLSARTKAFLQWHFAEAAERFADSPKWLTVGQAMSAKSDRLWPYRHVDVLVISLWPLVTKHNWTYRDLLAVIRPALKPPTADLRSPTSAPGSSLPSSFQYPLDREQDFASYCRNVLGLRKTGKGISTKDGCPPGHQIARHLFPLLLAF